MIVCCVCLGDESGGVDDDGVLSRVCLRPNAKVAATETPTGHHRSVHVHAIHVAFWVWAGADPQGIRRIGVG